MESRESSLGIWAYAFGYFACYAPYSALTKAISEGTLPGVRRPIQGFELLPITTVASLFAMIAFLSYQRWWGYAGTREILGRRVPCPGRWTFLSGLCTACIIATTTLAYTFSGVSIVFMMLLMRGGLLVLAPLIDLVGGRKVRWFSGVALALSLAALLLATLMRASGGSSWAITTVALVDVAVYLASYVVRLRFMSRMAKSEVRADTIRYFVEEQMVATPAIVLLLVVLAVIGQGELMLAVRRGFLEIWGLGGLTALLFIGVLSQGTGAFGGLILLDARENSFCVPVNRASSVLAGVLASVVLTWLAGTPPLPASEYSSAGLIVVAIVVLAWPTLSARFRPVGAR